LFRCICPGLSLRGKTVLRLQITDIHPLLLRELAVLVIVLERVYVYLIAARSYAIQNEYSVATGLYSV
jgi:hypothetical protein